MTRTHLTYHETATLRGGVYADLGTGAAVQPFKYGDKELDLSNGIARYDYTARAYVPATIRFDRIDPLAWKHPDQSPYIFCANNPVNNIDPDGRDALIIIENNVITVKANIFICGITANEKLAKTYGDKIQSVWGSKRGVTYKGETFKVNWDINVSVEEPGSNRDFNGINNYMEVVDGKETSHVDSSMNTGQLRSEGRDGYTLENDCPSAHELGHIMGLSDKYVTKSMAKKNPKLKINAPIAPKWKEDVMCVNTQEEAKVTTGTLTNLFSGALERHRTNRQAVKNGTVRTIVKRNKNHREPIP